MLARIDDIREEVRRRKVQGIIHYVQSFCHRQLHGVLLSRRLRVSVLTLEFDRPGPLTGQHKTRLEAFVEMLG
jgi:benzoyl-CoA reductase/2-hydroxyglutaryl-CoA dehydratase subunit BcrC/BadD/HgdB